MKNTITIFLLTIIFLTTSAQKFTEIDNYVFGLKTSKEATIEQTAKLVTAKSTSEIEKARAIFVWLADNIAYDVTFKVYDKDAAFKQRKSVCQGYAQLFEEMGKHVGLKSTIITGIGKNLLSAGPHAWNLVEIDNEKILIDATWGAGYVNGNKFTKLFDERWFNTDPHFFIFSHFPEDNQYQFINKNIDKKLFDILPSVNPALEKIGINGKEILDHFTKKATLGFPTFYSNPSKSNIIIKKMPFQKKLETGKTYRFHFNIPENIKMAFVNEGEWHHVTDSKEFDYSPKKKGKVVIYYKTPESESYTGLLEFEVK